MSQDKQIVAGGAGFITFQKPTIIIVNEAEHMMHGRTLEETFIYENLSLFQGGQLEIEIDFESLMSADAIKAEVYSTVINQNFKKTEFALSIAASAVAWSTPTYITDGLQWLEKKLNSSATPGVPANTAAKVGI